MGLGSAASPEKHPPIEVAQYENMYSVTRTTRPNAFYIHFSKCKSSKNVIDLCLTPGVTSVKISMPISCIAYGGVSHEQVIKTIALTLYVFKCKYALPLFDSTTSPDFKRKMLLDTHLLFTIGEYK